MLPSELEDGLTCPLCPKKLPFFRCLNQHLTTSHYRSEILKSNGVTDLRKCPVCLTPLSSDMTPKPSQESTIAFHIGMQHGYLEKVMHKDVKKSWMPLKEKHDEEQSQKKLKRQDELKQSQTKGSMVCPICGRELPSFSVLKNHICMVHFKRELMRLGGVSGGVPPDHKCDMCGRAWSKSIRKESARNVRFVVHLGGHHRFLEKVMPDEIKQQINDQLSKRGPTFKAKKLPLSKSKNEGQTCLLCHKIFQDAKSYSTHVTTVHFATDILAVKDQTDFRRCNVCQKPLGSDSSTTFSLRHTMLIHLALKHDFLLQVMEPKLREEYKSVMGKFKRKR